jgi:hypothetical protein
MVDTYNDNARIDIDPIAFVQEVLSWLINLQHLNLLFSEHTSERLYNMMQLIGPQLLQLRQLDVFTADPIPTPLFHKGFRNITAPKLKLGSLLGNDMTDLAEPRDYVSRHAFLPHPS